MLLFFVYFFGVSFRENSFRNFLTWRCVYIVVVLFIFCVLKISPRKFKTYYYIRQCSRRPCISLRVRQFERCPLHASLYAFYDVLISWYYEFFLINRASTGSMGRLKDVLALKLGLLPSWTKFGFLLGWLSTKLGRSESLMKDGLEFVPKKLV